MRPATRRLVSFAVLLLLLQVVAIPVAIIFRLAYQFGGPGDPNKVASDFVFLGTAITAPVIPILVVLAVAIFPVRSPRWWGALSAAVFCVLALLMFIGSLGEAFAPDTADVPKPVLLVSGLVNGALSLVLLFLAVAELAARMRARRGRINESTSPSTTS